MNGFVPNFSRKRALVQGVSVLALLALTKPLHAQSAPPPTPIPDVSVTGSRDQDIAGDHALQSDGTAANGYRADRLSGVGPLGPKPLLDTPYSISVVPRELIENIQAGSTDDVFRVNPFTQNSFPAARGNPFSVLIRGFASTTTTFDNMRTENGAIVDVEGLERVEVVQGLSGFLYGPADPGGLINFVLKRPTENAFAKLTIGDYSVGNYSAGSAYAHADFGGPIDKDGQFAYRINLVGQGGGTSISQQGTVRNYESVALDWHIAENVLAQFVTFHSFYRVTSPDPFWIISSPALHPVAPEADRSFSEPWGFYNNEQELAQAKLTWNINSVFTARTGFTFIHDATKQISIDNSTSSNTGQYGQYGVVNATSNLQTYSGFGLIDANFDTGPVKHKVTGGFFGERYNSILPNNDIAFPTAVGPLPGGLFSFFTPLYAQQPSATVGTLPSSLYFSRANENAVLGDQVELGPLMAIAGVTHTEILQNQYGPINVAAGKTRTLTSQDDAGQFTPSASLIYKVLPTFSIYGTYIQGLEPGGVAPSYAANSGTALPPELDKQYEVGAKAQVGGALLTFALFDINKAYTFVDPNDNTFKEAGREDHKGIELGASGKVWSDLTVYGGVTFLDPHITNDPTLDGLRPQNVSSHIFKLYSEYAVPFVHGLTVTGGLYYYGSFAANPQNTEFLPGYVTEDIGLRYQTVVDNLPLTARLTVTNLSNKSYWMSNSFVGQPRTISASLETHF